MAFFLLQTDSITEKESPPIMLVGHGRQITVLARIGSEEVGEWVTDYAAECQEGIMRGNRWHCSIFQCQKWGCRFR